jgi:signal transduction histidine kinase
MLPEQSGKPATARIDPRSIQEFARSILSLVDPSTLLSAITDHLRDLFGADLALILQRDSQRGDFIPLHSVGFDQALLRGAGFAGNGRLAGRLLSNRTCLALSEELRLEDHLDLWELELIRKLKVQVCTPLISREEITGMILLGSSDARWRLSREDLGLLDVLALHAALALESAQLQSRQRDRLRRFYRIERLTAEGQLAAGLAHEIRNPLTAISSTIQYILRDLPEADANRELVRELLSEVDRIHQTCESLLRLTRMDEPRQEEYDLLDTIDQALLLIEGQARQTEVQLEKSYTWDSFLVRGDRDQLKQVFLNLFLNALQAMDGTGGRLAVRAEPWSPPFGLKDEWVQVEIADTGCGIRPELLERIFNPFFTTRGEGTGLGMTISQAILERHEGEIEVQSKVEEGTYVFVRLPLSTRHGKDPDRRG